MQPLLMTEFNTYLRQLPVMLPEHDGEYVVIKGDEVLHFAPDYETALDWGYDKFELEDFFVKRVAPDAAVVHVTRDFNLCQ